MSEICPLCGNRRLDDSLFCADCAKKVKSDYEVDVPEKIKYPVNNQINKNNTFHKKEEGPKQRVEEKVSEEKVNSTREADNKNISDSREPVVNKYRSAIESDNNNFATNREPLEDIYTTKNRKKGSVLYRILSVILIITASYFLFYKFVLQRNLDRSAWEVALKENSVDSYLKYIESHPSGAHFDEAQEGLLTLKQLEASVWEALKASDNISELKDFIRQYTNSPYISLVELRLDSLSWVEAVTTNSAASYYEYLEVSRRGDLKGDYINEAQRRYEWLYQSEPIDDAEIDMIRGKVSSYYSSLELPVTYNPVLNSIQYKRLGNGYYEVNVPLEKNVSKNSRVEAVKGYIAHITLNSSYEVIRINETKPYTSAPD